MDPRLKMNDHYRGHPDEESLERFLLNRASDVELEALETHILDCEHCVEALKNLEIEIAATRLALIQLEAAQKILNRPAKGRSGWLASPRLCFSASVSIAAGALILFCIPRDVTIMAYREAEPAVVTRGRPLKIHLKGEGLPAGPVAAELTDAIGAVLWRGPAVARDDKVELRLPRITKAGAHILRLYSLPNDGAKAQLLREFALNVRWDFFPVHPDPMAQ